MLLTLFSIWLLAGPQADSFKREATALQGAVNDAVTSSVTGNAILQTAKSTYIEGFGVVVTVEVALEPPPNPFSNPKTPAEVRRIISERRPALQKKIEALLKERVPNMESVGAAESVAIVVHLFNSIPAELPDLPSQLVFIVKKQDPINVVIRQLK